MEQHQLEESQLTSFCEHLREEEKSPGTVEKYARDVRAFFGWLKKRPVTKKVALQWKEYLINAQYAPVTINSMIASVNQFFYFNGWAEYKIKPLKIQRKLFRGETKELTREEYIRLLNTAKKLKKERLALLMETICATGIRVSELRYITIENLQKGRTEISLKGKIRTILVPDKLAHKLLKYAKRHKIAAGEIFITKNGKGIGRKQIWAEMKKLCKAAGVAESKVFPHNLRHLFARSYYRVCRDIVKLADVLGHSSVETTRIYLLSTGQEHAKYLEHLGLVC